MAQVNQIAEVRLQLDNMLGQFRAVLPKHITAERFGRVVLTAIQQTPELLECERRSLWNAAMRAANDGLLPDGRLGAIVIYKDRRKNAKQAQWLPMIAGIRQKVRNSGEIADWTAHVVHERDVWDYEEGDNPHIFHKPVRGDRGAVIAAYSIAKYRSGEVSREWMWIEEIDKVRAVSKAEHGPWHDWPFEMMRKTVAKRHAKVLPMSSDLDDLLREPGEGDDPQTPQTRGPQPRRLTSIGDVLDNLSGGAGAARKPMEIGPAPSADADDDGVVDDDIADAGEYAEGDDEQQLPLEKRHGSG